LHQVEKEVAEHGSKLAATDRTAIENAMANLREAVKGDDGPMISAKAGVLQQHAMKLAEAAQAASQASSGFSADRASLTMTGSSMPSSRKSTTTRSSPSHRRESQATACRRPCARRGDRNEQLPE
jgi:hypothetical protein